MGIILTAIVLSGVGLIFIYGIARNIRRNFQGQASVFPNKNPLRMEEDDNRWIALIFNCGYLALGLYAIYSVLMYFTASAVLWFTKNGR